MSNDLGLESSGTTLVFKSAAPNVTEIVAEVRGDTGADRGYILLDGPFFVVFNLLMTAHNNCLTAGFALSEERVQLTFVRCPVETFKLFQTLDPGCVRIKGSVAPSERVKANSPYRRVFDGHSRKVA